jgi:hypothetical protein
MTPDSRNDFRLNFNSSLGVVMTLNVPRARVTASGPQVAAAMDAIIAANVVLSARGTPVSRHSAEMITTLQKDFQITH